MMIDPRTGIAISKAPRWLPDGETSAELQRPKKKRLVNSTISFNKPSAIKDARAPMAMASSEIGITRGVRVKSPRLLETRVARLSLLGMGPPDDGIERADQRGARAAQFVEVRLGEFFERGVSARGDADNDAAAVICRAGPANQAAARKAIDQLNRGVVLDLQAFGENADHGVGIRLSAEGKQELMVLRFELDGARG